MVPFWSFSPTTYRVQGNVLRSWEGLTVGLVGSTDVAFPFPLPLPLSPSGPPGRAGPGVGPLLFPFPLLAELGLDSSASVLEGALAPLAPPGEGGPLPLPLALPRGGASSFGGASSVGCDVVSDSGGGAGDSASEADVELSPPPAPRRPVSVTRSSAETSCSSSPRSFFPAALGGAAAGVSITTPCSSKMAMRVRSSSISDTFSRNASFSRIAEASCVFRTKRVPIVPCSPSPRPAVALASFLGSSFSDAGGGSFSWITWRLRP
mmetsp:Transcript_4242/g.9891  ORF Transcript_4242/g.9891 Transcript_4242/m.9891 type:complete len:264 (-) Transcript_4242:589-1380(-)